MILESGKVFTGVGMLCGRGAPGLACFFWMLTPALARCSPSQGNTCIGGGT